MDEDFELYSGVAFVIRFLRYLLAIWYILLIGAIILLSGFIATGNSRADKNENIGEFTNSTSQRLRGFNVKR